jgi:hypothetical protein
MEPTTFRVVEQYSTNYIAVCPQSIVSNEKLFYFSVTSLTTVLNLFQRFGALFIDMISVVVKANER